MLTFLRRLNRPLFAILAVAAIAGGLRFARLSYPGERVFDEAYYPKAGCILIGGTNKQCGVTSWQEKTWREQQWDVGSWVHPPLGKWMIGLGEKAFGFGPFGWRFSAALAGTLSCILLAAIAQVLWRKPIWTFVAGLLLATENLNFVMSRTAMLDIFLAFWVVLGFFFLAVDRRWIDARTTPDEPDPVTGAPPSIRVASPLWRPWRFAAGVAFGGAFATKWSGFTALLTAAALSLMWESVRRRRAGRPMLRAFGRAVAREGLGLVLAFFIVPAIVYVLVYLPHVNHFDWSIAEFWHQQEGMWNYHRDLEATSKDAETGLYTPIHSYLSPAWQWFPMFRSVLYYARYDGDIREVIYAIGNPAIFWLGIFNLGFVGYAWRRMRDWSAGYILLGLLIQYLPWLAVSRPQFFFYATPLTPFMVLAGTYAAMNLSEATIVLRDPATGDLYESTHHPYRPFAWIFVIGSVALFSWFYPVLTGMPVTTFWFRARMWVNGWT